MIIKIATISSSHGHNAIEYAMNKKVSDKEKPKFLASAHLPENSFLSPVDSKTVWDKMRIRQVNSGHKLEKGFFRIEICPSAEESRGWTTEDWKKLLDDAIRHLDNTDFLGKNGKVIGKHANIANSQYIATVHHDTDKPHIHLIVNRVSEDNEVQDDTRCRNRGLLAANSVAVERGWIKAEDRASMRKKQIHDDAINVLASMRRFSLEKYFNLMRMRGWIIDAKYDGKGICWGYSIGEKKYKADGSLSSTVLIQSSKLGFGRDLMVSKLQGTWNSLHRPQVSNVDRETSAEGTASIPLYNEVESKTTMGETVSKVPQWKCSSYDAMRNWNDEEIMSARVPDVAFEAIKGLVKLDRLDYWDKDEDIPSRAAMVAASVFEFCTAADAPVASGGGGGGSSDNDLRWDGMTKSDFEKMAEMAVKKVTSNCTSHLHRKGRGLGR